MKRILITGKNSYIGTSFEKWLANKPEEYKIEKISVRDESWKQHDFSVYDTVIHLAGIAHVSRDPKMEETYYKVNRDLTIDLAKHAKNQGVKQFMFMSSIIVYGDSTKDRQVIDEDTVPQPRNFYGNSKLQAEKGITPLQDENFNVVIIRPPMIYGKGSKGNYPKLAKAAQKLPVFPDIDNQRSMLHVDNLCEFLRLLIRNNESGLFFPQNKEYIKTSDMVKTISNVHGNEIKLVNIFNPILKPFISKVETINKVFGSFIYDHNLSNYKDNYQIRNFNDSINLTEDNNVNLEVLVMSDNNLDTVGGEQESSKIIINGMKGFFQVGVIQPGEIKNPISGAHFYHLTSYTRIKHLIKHPFSFLSYILKVRKILRNQNPSVVHTQAQVSFFIVALLKKFKLISKDISFIHTERGLYTKYNKIIKQIFHFFLKELDVLVTTTEFNMRYWKNAIQSRGMNLECKVIENTAGELFETYNERFHKINTGSLVIGFAGRYTEWKNWPLAVEICKLLNKELKDKLYVKFAVGCLDEWSKVETKKMFDDLYKVLGNRFEGVINIDLKEMNNFYYELDVFILTSNYNTESFGRTLVEAMSRRTVVLTTDAGGSVEVVGNKDNVCVTSNDFVDRVLDFYKNKKLMEDEKENNHSRVKQKYSLKNNLDKHFNLYNKINYKKNDLYFLNK